MFIIEIIEEKNRWDKLVTSFSKWDVAHEWGYFEAFRKRDETFHSKLFYFENEYGRIAYPFFEKESTLSSVYGYTGPLFEGRDIDKAWNNFSEDLREYCKKKQITSVKERFHPLFNNERKLFNESEIKRIRDVIIKKSNSKEKLEISYAKQDKRRGVRFARKNNVKIEIRGIEVIDDFLRIYQQTMERNHAQDIYYFDKEFFQILAENFDERFIVIQAVFEEKIIASAVYLYSPSCAYGFLKASNKNFDKLFPSYLLIHEAYAYFYSIGVVRVNEGGGRTADIDDNLLRFKRGFVSKNMEVKEEFPYFNGETILNKK